MPSHIVFLNLSKILNKRDFLIISLPMLAALEDIKMLIPLPHDILFTVIFEFCLSVLKKESSVSPGLSQVYNQHLHHKKNGTKLCHYPRYLLKSDLKDIGHCIGLQFLKSHKNARITKSTKKESTQKSNFFFNLLD